MRWAGNKGVSLSDGTYVGETVDERNRSTKASRGHIGRRDVRKMRYYGNDNSYSGAVSAATIHVCTQQSDCELVVMTTRFLFNFFVAS